MISRKSFCRRISEIIVAVALAPEIAFGAKFQIAPSKPPLDLKALFDALYVLHQKRISGELDNYGRWTSTYDAPLLT